MKDYPPKLAPQTTEPQQKTAPQPEPLEPGTHSHHPDATATECDLEPTDDSLTEHSRADKEDDARTAQAADAFNLSPLDTRGPGWEL